MIRYSAAGTYLVNGKPTAAASVPQSEARKRTMAYQILSAHNRGDEKDLRLTFDALVSHDITYVGIIQTARAAGLTQFPVPYALTNCHNSLCAVGGTINEDDHVFGLSAAKKYGGIYVPANESVIHAYAREALAICGGMILGSDSHTRYGALGAMGVGEGGPELVKQLLRRTYDVKAPEVVLVYLTGKPKRGVGPHDVALALVGATFGQGLVKNKILEFTGPGLSSLSADFRCGVDVMTTETTCLSSIWETDDVIKEYYGTHGRPEAYRRMVPGDAAWYDAMIEIDLSAMESMIALPFHPSNVYSIHYFNEHAKELLEKVEAEAAEKFGKARLSLTQKIQPDGRVLADQGVIAGCAGGLFDNVEAAASILRGGSTGNGAFSLSVYPASVPVSLALTRAGDVADLLSAGAVIKPAFCGPCFGAGDVPANNGLSLRHTTRNFPNREGAKPGEGQLAGVALMDARSIAATAKNGGVITAATDLTYDDARHAYAFDGGVYQKRVYNGFGRPQPDVELVMGPNIADWPKQYPLGRHALLRFAAVIHDPVTTTDELIPSGETSSYRSNPLRLAAFTLSRRCPDYVAKARAIYEEEAVRRAGKAPDGIEKLLQKHGLDASVTEIGSVLFAKKPGDGSAREQAASCQRVLGGLANIAYEYATKRYRSNCINWGMLPFTLSRDDPADFAPGDIVLIPDVREKLARGDETFPAVLVRENGEETPLTLTLSGLTDEERDILLAGCLTNHYAAQSAKA